MQPKRAADKMLSVMFVPLHQAKLETSTHTFAYRLQWNSWLPMQIFTCLSGAASLQNWLCVCILKTWSLLKEKLMICICKFVFLKNFYNKITKNLVQFGLLVKHKKNEKLRYHLAIIYRGGSICVAQWGSHLCCRGKNEHIFTRIVTTLWHMRGVLKTTPGLQLDFWICVCQHDNMTYIHILYILATLICML